VGLRGLPSWQAIGLGGRSSLQLIATFWVSAPVAL
jgi:hypothetical protein